MQLREALQHCAPKPAFVPAAAIAAPPPSHFVRVAADEGAQTECPRLPAPQECLLRGKGFVDAPALWRRSEAEHCSWAEARKRILWEVDSLHCLPLTPSWKRRLLQNFSQALTVSQPGRGHYGRDKACMRQRAGCATCARVVWIEDAMPCYLFRECPERILQDAGNDSDSSAASCGSATEQPADACCGEHRLLRDDSGYYVRSAEDIDEILGIAAYARAWPHIPLEELHASSVQHPGRSDCRWLLNTRRAPTWNAPTPPQLQLAHSAGSTPLEAMLQSRLPRPWIGSPRQASTALICRPARELQIRTSPSGFATCAPRNYASVSPPCRRSPS